MFYIVLTGSGASGALSIFPEPKADHKKTLTSRRNKHCFSAKSWSIEEQCDTEITRLRGFEENRLKPRLLGTIFHAKKKFYDPGPPFWSKNMYFYWQESIFERSIQFSKIWDSPIQSQTIPGISRFFLAWKSVSTILVLQGFAIGVVVFGISVSHCSSRRVADFQKIRMLHIMIQTRPLNTLYNV